MLAVTITQQANPVAPNVTLTQDWPEPPAPPAGHARLRTLATALNQLDLWVGRGVPGLSLEYPRISGCDVCAEVEAVGPETDQSWIGQRVIMNAAVVQPESQHPDDPTNAHLAPAYELIGEHTNGAHCLNFNAPVANLRPVRHDADPTHAAAVGLTTLTAYSMMVTKAQLKPGQTVLITGIGGGVALAALAIAKHLGCPTAVTSRHRWKLDKALELGADLAVEHDEGNFHRPVREWTRKRGVDLAVDSSGKATHLACIKSLARGGAYVCPGCTSGPDAVTDLARLFWNQLRLLGSTMGTNDEFAEVASLFNAGALGSVVDSVHAPQDASSAFARLESGDQFGKVVIDWTGV